MPRKAHKARVTIYRQKPKLKPQFSNPTSTPKLQRVEAEQSTSGTKFQALPPLRTARSYAEKEVIDKALPTEIAWLYEHPILWLRALQQIRKEVQNHLCKARLNLNAKRTFPVMGAPPPEYLEYKQQQAGLQLKQRHFLRLVERRLEDVTTLLGTDKPVSNADYVRALLSLAQLIDDEDVQAAHDLALDMADRITKQQSTTSTRKK